MCSDSLILDLFQWCTGHHETDLFDQSMVWLRRCDLDFAHDLPFVNHVNAVAERQQFLQLFRDQEYGCTRLALSQQQAMDTLDRADIQPAGWLDRDHEVRLPRDLARQDHA